MNKNSIVGAIVGVCSSLTSMNALNGALNYATGKPGDEKQRNLIFSIGIVAISALVGVATGKGAVKIMEGVDRVGQAVNDKIANDIAMDVESEPVCETTVSNEDWTQFQEDMKDWSYAEPTDAEKEG